MDIAEGLRPPAVACATGDWLVDAIGVEVPEIGLTDSSDPEGGICGDIDTFCAFAAASASAFAAAAAAASAAILSSSRIRCCSFFKSLCRTDIARTFEQGQYPAKA